MKKALITLGALVLGVLILAGLARAIVRGAAAPEAGPGAARAAGREGTVYEFDPELGWQHKASLHALDLFGPGLHLSTNSQRMRAPRDYAAAIPAGSYRVVCLGASLTVGTGVADDETFPSVMEREVAGLEAINMGRGAYSPAQCYLWYLRDGLAFTTDALVLSVVDDDFARMAPTYGLAPGARRPVLVLRDGALRAERVRSPEELARSAGEQAPSETALGRFLHGLALTRLCASRCADAERGETVSAPAEAAVLEALLR